MTVTTKDQKWSLQQLIKLKIANHILVFQFLPFSIQIPVLGWDYRDCFSKWGRRYYQFPEGQKVKPPGWESTTNKCSLNIWWLWPLEGKSGPGNFALNLAKCSAYKCDDFMVAA